MNTHSPMNTALEAQAGIEVLEPGELTLAELAEAIEQEHQRVIETGTAMIEHAIRAGRHLLLARERVPRGTFQKWLIDNFGRADTQWASAHLYTYMRIARHSDLVRASGVQTITQARMMLSRTVVTAGSGHRPLDLDEDTIRLAREKHITQKEAARRLGVSIATVRSRLDGGKHNRQKQKKLREARKALRREQRDANVAAAGGSIAKAYSLLRKALQELDRAEAAAPNREARAAIAGAIAHMHGVEDDVARAVRLS